MSSQVVSNTAGRLLLGDEAVALAASDAGISAGYAYPGTPATEIMEALIRAGTPKAQWCANEKTALEAALGVSMAGRRVLVSMKHVGLNVAADPFMNAAVVAPKGGLVIVVADDPGMHSSQNEQDSRYYADFAGIPCLEPADPQQAYDMTRDAFELSEHFRIPVMLRLVTRIAHQRANVIPAEAGSENPLDTDIVRSEWVLLPSFARKQWRTRLDQREEIRNWSEASRYNNLERNDAFGDLGVITTGIALHYYLEAAQWYGVKPSHLHIGTYPVAKEKVRRFAEHVKEVLVLEDGYPFVERMLRGIIPPRLGIRGRDTGAVGPDGELSADAVRRALGVEVAAPVDHKKIDLPGRPPRLCDGCPHIDTYDALAIALQGFDSRIVTSDIGCYTLGALPPHQMGDSCVCMGASIGMAKGAADAGAHPVVAVIGDSTFLHSGMTPLMDAIAHDTDMTVLILDNQVVAMTGAQPTLVSTERLRDLVVGLGVAPEHCHRIEAHPRKVKELAALMRLEIEHHGLSVIIAHRECIEAAKKHKPRREA